MDLRIKRTRLFIRNAFFDLIREKGFEAVTIGDITERAMINRSTFYRHYRDKFDLAEKCLDEPFNALLKEMETLKEAPGDPNSQAPPNFVLVLGHIEENVDLYRMLFGRNGITVFIARLRDYILKLLRYRLRDVTRDDMDGMIPLDMFEEYLAGAYIGTIQWWLDQMETYSAQEVALWLYQLVVQGTDTALGPRGIESR